MCLEGLGDTVERALSRVGLTVDRVERWIGDCGCKQRKDRLNQLGNWASRILQGKVNKAKEYLDEILNQGSE